MSRKCAVEEYPWSASSAAATPHPDNGRATPSRPLATRRPPRPAWTCYATDVVWRWERLANCGEPVQARPGLAVATATCDTATQRRCACRV